LCTCTWFGCEKPVFNQLGTASLGCFRIYRETLSRFSCAASALMNTYSAKGYINNNKQYEFQAFINLSDDDKNQFNGDLEYNEKNLGKLFKEKDHKNELKPTDIIKKEHLDKSEYEAEPPLFFFSGPIE
ncbi:DUF1433 domain-containing protein, partial [Staphylococcus aureus]